MKAVVCTKYGPPEVLQAIIIDKPIPKDNEVLVKIHATTVTKFDCWIRSSSRMFRFLMRLATGIRFPKDTILGTELAGEIEAVGKDVTSFNKGDQVFAFLGMRMGAYAEYICLQEESVMATKPINMTYDETAAVQQGALSALYFLRMINIQKGQKILVYGASGVIVVNRTRAEFFTLIPLGYKLWTLVSKSETLMALGLLLRQSDEINASGDIVGERKGFPFKPDDEWVGRWAGDEITIVGDYDTSLLYQWANVEYTDISIQVQKMLNVFVASERMH